MTSRLGACSCSCSPRRTSPRWKARSWGPRNEVWQDVQAGGGGPVLQPCPGVPAVPVLLGRAQDLLRGPGGALLHLRAERFQPQGYLHGPCALQGGKGQEPLEANVFSGV